MLPKTGTIEFSARRGMPNRRLWRRQPALVLPGPRFPRHSFGPNWPSVSGQTSVWAGDLRAVHGQRNAGPNDNLRKCLTLTFAPKSPT